MQIYDFEYDGIKLSEMGFMVCTFGKAGMETVSSGCQIKFNTIPTLNGSKHELTSVEYEDCVEATFEICKHPCRGIGESISYKEYNNIMSWLNRKQFHLFKFIDGIFENVYVEASFNIKRIEMDGKLYGLELNMITNKPYGFRKDNYQAFQFATGDLTKIFYNESAEEGFIYPKTIITVNSSGNLDLYNDIEQRHTYIANCTQSEVITLDYPIITTSLASHKIQNDFNWNFFRVASTFKRKDNHLTASLPCKLELTYNPIVKLIV